MLLESSLTTWTRIDFADILEQTHQISPSHYMSDFGHTEDFRRERRVERNAAHLFTRACQSGDVLLFDEAVSRISETVDGWLVAMRKVVREVRAVSPQIRSAFQAVWIESKMLPLHVGNHRALCNAARLLLPKYSGPPVRLFRGAGAAERRRRIYGLSWSADIDCATRFADGRRVWDGGSVLFETLAASEAIICKITYPPPLTQKEIKALKRKYPRITIDEFHEEQEYLVDRRYLNVVKVVRRYAQTFPE